MKNVNDWLLEVDTVGFLKNITVVALGLCACFLAYKICTDVEWLANVTEYIRNIPEK